MNIKTQETIIQFIMVLLILINLSGCSNTEKLTKEQLLLQSISELESRFESRKLGSIAEYISKDYSDGTGLKFRDIKRVIQLQLMRHKTLHIFSTVKNIEWKDDSNVQVHIVAALAGKPIGSATMLTSIRADMIDFTVDFVFDNSVYKVQSSRWKWANLSDFL